MKNTFWNDLPSQHGPPPPTPRRPPRKQAQLACLQRTPAVATSPSPPRPSRSPVYRAGHGHHHHPRAPEGQGAVSAVPTPHAAQRPSFHPCYHMLSDIHTTLTSPFTHQLLPLEKEPSTLLFLKPPPPTPISECISSHVHFIPSCQSHPDCE